MTANNTRAHTANTADITAAVEMARSSLKRGDRMVDACANAAFAVMSPLAELGEVRKVSHEIEARLTEAPKKARRSSTPKTQEDLESLPEIRISSHVGPCLRRYRQVRVNRTTVTAAAKNGRTGVLVERFPKYSVHSEPCTRCTDHPNTVYPDGYMD